MHVGEDVDFVWRMAAAGWRVRYEPEAVMGHDHRVTFRAWFARRADYGTSAAALEQLHPGAVRPLYASWWTAGAWAAALARRPVTAAALTAAATALLARRLSRVTGERWPVPAVARTSSCAVDSGFRPSNAHDNREVHPLTDNSKKRLDAGSLPRLPRGAWRCGWPAAGPPPPPAPSAAPCLVPGGRRPSPPRLPCQSCVLR